MARSYRLLIICLTLVLFASVLAYAADNSEKGKAVGQGDIIYFIMTDRFANGDKANDFTANTKDMKAYHGGDLQGVIDKLDYISELGTTAIWITPVVANDPGGYHGYWASDFYQVDKHLGDINKLKELTQKAHEKGIKVIVDLVVNHTGVLNPWVSDEKYKSWFHATGTITNWNDQNEIETGKLAGLPDLAQENPEVKKYLIDMAKWWIEQTGIDGYRLDTVRHVPKDFWKEFSTEIKRSYPDFYMIGEAWNADPNYVNQYQKSGLDGMIDFPMYYAITDVFARGKNMQILESAINKSDIYNNKYLMGTFIDNHDVFRFTSMAGTMKEEKLKQALAFEMTYTGIPIIYYGTEIAMEGSEDPSNRKDMEWDKQSSVRDYLKQLTKLRTTHTEFTKGDIKVLAANNYFIAYLRSYKGKVAIVMLNSLNKDNEQKVTIANELANQNLRLVNAFDSEDKLQLNSNEISVNLGSKESKIYNLSES